MCFCLISLKIVVFESDLPLRFSGGLRGLLQRYLLFVGDLVALVL
jgi:hypothetical protein